MFEMVLPQVQGKFNPNCNSANDKIKGASLKEKTQIIFLL